MPLADFQEYEDLYDNLRTGSAEHQQWDPPKPAKDTKMPPPPSAERKPTISILRKPKLQFGALPAAAVATTAVTMATPRPTPSPLADMNRQSSAPAVTPTPAVRFAPRVTDITNMAKMPLHAHSQPQHIGLLLPLPTQVMVPMSAQQLFYHVLHLATTLTDGLSTYLSVEVLLRDLSSQNRGFFNLAQQLSNTGAMLIETKGVIAGACGQLTRRPEHHIEFAKEECYGSLIKAVEILTQAVFWIPDARIGENFPGQEKLLNIRGFWLEAKALREGGGPDKKQGWEKCWTMVQYCPAPPVGR